MVKLQKDISGFLKMLFILVLVDLFMSNWSIFSIISSWISGYFSKNIFWFFYSLSTLIYSGDLSSNFWKRFVLVACLIFKKAFSSYEISFNSFSGFIKRRVALLARLISKYLLRVLAMWISPLFNDITLCILGNTSVKLLNGSLSVSLFFSSYSYQNNRTSFSISSHVVSLVTLKSYSTYSTFLVSTPVFFLIS